MCAAHCFDKDQSMSGYYVTAGVKDRKDNVGGQTIEIANGVWNNAMPYVGNNNDFIILKLKSALTFNENVGAACLPEPSHAPDATGQTCFVSGWGTLESGANGLPDDLQWVAVPTVTNALCNEAYNGITESMICAGLPEGGKDSCQGDSGDPTEGPTEGPTVAPTACVDQWIGDSFCDDQNNNPECDFDGGDCCPEEPANGWDQYCSDCECFDIPETTEAPIECTGVNQWIGDNYCDDVNNNPECDFDGGDCCQEAPANGWDQYCEDCECFDMPETTEPPM